MAVWGDDSFTPEIDGATDGQLINLHLIDSNLLYDINTSLNYVTNNLDVISNEVSPVLTCTAENLGCTDTSIQKQSLKTVLVLIQKPISTAMAIVSMTVMQMAYVMNWKYQGALIQTQATTTT